MSTSSDVNYNDLKISMTKRLKGIIEYPYLRDDALDRAMRSKGVYFQDAFFTYNLKDFKDKIYGDGFDITQFDKFESVPSRSYPNPYIVKLKLKDLKRTHKNNITRE